MANMWIWALDNARWTSTVVTLDFILISNDNGDSVRFRRIGRARLPVCAREAHGQ